MLLFNVQQQQPTSSMGFLDRLPFFQGQPGKGDILSEDRNEKILDLLRAASEVGQVGSLASEEDQQKMERLAELAYPLSEFDKPAQVPSAGEHTLVYSAAPGASSGRVFGNVVGKVSQLFENDEIFYNRVTFGPLMVALKARREIKNGSTIKVSFLENTISLFGKTLTQKEIGGGGVWKVRFVGKVKDNDGKEKLVRVMETPSLFVLEQPLN